MITIGGYDIRRDVYFSAVPVNVPLEDKFGDGPLRLSQNRVVWEAQPDFEPGRLFTALIIQD